MLRSSPNVSTTAEYTSYASAIERNNLFDYELDAMVKFEIISDTEPSKSWESIDEKFGRVRAFQVAE